MDDFPTVGIVGGGQLARMAQQSAIALGVNLRVLAAAAGDSAALVINDVRVGDHDDAAAVLAFADGVDAVTFDHEHVPSAILQELQERNIAVRPGPDALLHAQDKIVMRQALTDAGLPCPRWAALDADAEAETFRRKIEELGEGVGWPIVLKT